MAAGASQLDQKYGGRYGCNVTRFGGAVNGHMGGRAGWGSSTSLLASLPGAVVLDDEDYAIEEQKEDFEDDPSLLAVPKDRKREMEKERQAFREERKRMRKEEQPTKADDRQEKKLELNPLLKIKTKEEAAALSSSLQGEEVLPTAETDVARSAAELADANSDSASPSVPDAHEAVEATEQTSSNAALASKQASVAIGGLLGGYASDDDSSDIDESTGISTYNYLNLKPQDKMTPRGPSMFTKKDNVAEAISKGPHATQPKSQSVLEAPPQRRFPLPKCRSPAVSPPSGDAVTVEHPLAGVAPITETVQTSGGAGRASLQPRFPLPLRRFPLPKNRSLVTHEPPRIAVQEVEVPAKATAPAKINTLEMKEVSPALAALMSGLDC